MKTSDNTLCTEYSGPVSVQALCSRQLGTVGRCRETGECYKVVVEGNIVKSEPETVKQGRGHQ